LRFPTTTGRMVCQTTRIPQEPASCSGIHPPPPKPGRELRRRPWSVGLCRHCNAATVRKQGMTARVYESGEARTAPGTGIAIPARAAMVESMQYSYRSRKSCEQEGLERAIRARSRNPEIRQPRRRPFSTCGRTSSFTTNVERAVFDERPVSGRFAKSDGETVTARCFRAPPPAACRMRKNARYQGDRSLQG